MLFISGLDMLVFGLMVFNLCLDSMFRAHFHWLLFFPSPYLAVTMNVQMLFFIFTFLVRTLVQNKEFFISDLALKVHLAALGSMKKSNVLKKYFPRTISLFHFTHEQF